MKTLPALLAAAFLSAPSLFAQARLSVDRAPQVAPEPTSEEVSLIPGEVPKVEKPKGRALDGQDGGKKSKTDENTEALNARIRFREAKTKAERDPQVRAAWERSLSAPNDYEKRQALKSYYQLLYTRIARIDSSVKKLVSERQVLALRHLEQKRIDPTVPPGR